MAQVFEFPDPLLSSHLLSDAFRRLGMEEVADQILESTSDEKEDPALM